VAEFINGVLFAFLVFGVPYLVYMALEALML
jgi:hypothetical protein